MKEIVKGVPFEDYIEFFKRVSNFHSGNPYDGKTFVLFKELATKHATAVLEAFIDDHFPEDSLDCQTSMAAKLANLQPGDSMSFLAECAIEPTVKRKFNIEIPPGYLEALDRFRRNDPKPVEEHVWKDHGHYYSRPLTVQELDAYIGAPGSAITDEVSKLCDTIPKDCRIIPYEEAKKLWDVECTADKPLYKKGDCVKITGKSRYNHCFDIGTVCTVTGDIDRDSYFLDGQTDGNRFGQIVDSKDFEPCSVPKYDVGQECYVVDKNSIDLWTIIGVDDDNEGDYVIYEVEDSVGETLYLTEEELFVTVDELVAYLQKEAKKL